MTNENSFSASFSCLSELIENKQKYNLTPKQIKSIEIAQKALLTIEMLGIASSYDHKLKD